MSGSVPETSWILSSDGVLKETDGPVAPLVLDPETQTAKDVPAGTNQAVIIQFASFADGRGFSLARRLREAHGPELEILAQGHILPDQARHAFQSGFNAILISDKELERQGRQSWNAALQNAVGTLYVGETSGGGIWTRRLQGDTAARL